MENKKTNKYFSIKTKVTFTIVSFVVLIVTSIFVVLYFNTKQISNEDIKNRLYHMVSISSLQLDGQGHGLLKTRDDENTDIYRSLINILKKIDASSNDIYYIYTMNKNEKGEIVFILDPDDADPNNISHIGEVYKEPSQFLKENFSKINSPVVEDDLYTDEWGTWLSGYAPIYDKNGYKEGILGIDISADDLSKVRNNLLLIYFVGYIIFILLAIVLSFVLSKRLSSSIVYLTNVLKNKDISIENTNSSDEIGELTNVLKTKIDDINLSQKEKDESILEKNKTLEKINKLMVGRELEMIKLKKELSELKKNEK